MTLSNKTRWPACVALTLGGLIGCGGSDGGVDQLAGEDVGSASEALIAGATIKPTLQTSGNYTLSAAGNIDWVDWGQKSETWLDRKANVPQLIRNFQKIGNGTVGWFGGGGPLAFSWTGGTPTASMTSTRSYVSMCGLNNGFSVSVPASTQTRRLRLYVSAANATASVRARVQGTTTEDTTFTKTSGFVYGYEDVYFASTSTNQDLVVDLAVKTAFAGGNSCVGLLAAELSNVTSSATVTLEHVPFTSFNNVAYVQGNTVRLRANVSSSVGVKAVEFKNGSTVVATDTSAPYEFDVVNLPAGPNRFTAEVTDGLNASKVSAPLDIYGWYAMTNGSGIIPDDNTWFIKDLEPYSTSGKTIKEAMVYLNVKHPYISDLQIEIQSASGRNVRIVDRVGGSGDDFLYTFLRDSATTPLASGTPPFNGMFQPQNPLSTFIGDAWNWGWTIRFRDAGPADQGEAYTSYFLARLD